MRGYNASEVRSFLEFVAKELETLGKENRYLADQLAVSEKQLTRLAGQEDRIKETLLMAQKAADDLRAAARQEASAILRQAESQRGEIAAEMERLRAERDAFVAQLRSFLDIFYEKLAPAHAVVERSEVGREVGL